MLAVSSMCGGAQGTFSPSWARGQWSNRLEPTRGKFPAKLGMTSSNVQDGQRVELAGHSPLGGGMLFLTL